MKLEKRNIDETKEKELTDDNLVQFVVEKIKKIVKEDFAKFSAFAAVIFSVGLWIIKSIWYTYLLGKFSVYNIDECYINANNEKVILQIVQLASILVVWILIDYMYYKILVAEDKSWKKRIKILIFWIAEMVFIFFTFLRYYVDEISKRNILSYIIALLFICLMINIFAIEFWIEEQLKRKKAKKIDNQESGNIIKKRIKNMFLIVIITIAIELISAFWSARNTEYDRCGYKVIMVQSEKATESEFFIEYGEDKNKYEIYPIAYENEDCYIVTRLCNENGKIKIDYNYQKIIEKEGQETIYVENIYNISMDN